MNREFKFRAWDLLAEPPKMEHCGLERAAYHNNIDNPLMQYAGLKDKSGKEIYEGDILRFKYAGKYFIGYVCYGLTDTDRGCWMVRCDKERFFMCAIFQIEKLGNIYENPELLNATKEEK